MNDLTEKQRQIFDFLCASLREEGSIPTVREIGRAFGMASTNAVHAHLAALERKGYISRRPGAARGIELAPDFLAPQRGLPIVGRVAAGRPIEAVENLDGYLDLDVLYDPADHYALRVSGDSMVDAGIWDGDFVVVRQQAHVESGAIGVAIIDEETTVKRFRWLDNGGLELIPANEKYHPFVVNEHSDFRIGGKVVGMHRVF